MRIMPDGAIYTSANLTSFGSTNLAGIIVNGKTTFSQRAELGNSPLDKVDIYGKFAAHHVVSIGDDPSDRLFVGARALLEGPVFSNGESNFSLGRCMADRSHRPWARRD
jgi:hypothetical protein